MKNYQNEIEKIKPSKKLYAAKTWTWKLEENNINIKKNNWRNSMIMQGRPNNKVDQTS